MKRLTLPLAISLLLSACATDPLLQRCYQEVQASDFPFGKRITLDFQAAGLHREPDGGREWAVIPVKDQQGNQDWLVCIYEVRTGRLISNNSPEVIERQVSCMEPCRVDFWNF